MARESLGSEMGQSNEGVGEAGMEAKKMRGGLGRGTEEYAGWPYWLCENISPFDQIKKVNQ